MGTVTADSVGGFMQSFDVPTGLGLGGYRLIAMASDGDEVASLNVEILAAPAEASDHMDTPGGHDEGEPSDEHMEVDRAGNPLVMGGAVVGVVLALGAGMLLIRKQ